jgi:hypothetical protein
VQSPEFKTQSHTPPKKREEKNEIRDKKWKCVTSEFRNHIWPHYPWLGQVHRAWGSRQWRKSERHEFLSWGDFMSTCYAPLWVNGVGAAHTSLGCDWRLWRLSPAFPQAYPSSWAFKPVRIGMLSSQQLYHFATLEILPHVSGTTVTASTPWLALVQAH